MTHRPRRAATALVLVGALGLAGCSGDAEGSSETVTVTADAPAESDATTDAADGETDGAEETDATGTTDEETDGPIEPAEPQTIEINEEQSHVWDERGYTITLHNVTVQEYHVEAEITVVNDSTERIPMWHSAQHLGQPQLHDDRGRTYEFQIQAGANNRFHLEGGEGLNAVLSFAGRVDPSANHLTLDFESMGDGWRQTNFTIPLGGQQ
ncbi:MAG: hypothetical protein Q4G67_09820 [Actinomycetia bacterium]|nr:hypothetical protein [Actinomycetes bacterium]